MPSDEQQLLIVGVSVGVSALLVVSCWLCCLPMAKQYRKQQKAVAAMVAGKDKDMAMEEERLEEDAFTKGVLESLKEV